MMMMADVDDKLSLMGLEEELTCSICLCPFDCPVTIPCGHNFCQDCLLTTWRDSYVCPQCRTTFATKPKLTKNTVLATVVEAFKMKSNQSESEDSESEPDLYEEAEPVDAEKGKRRARGTRGKKKKAAEPVPLPVPAAILCDTCMEDVAYKTCLTCMASYCAVHLRPHHENLIFRTHELAEPVGDLAERICQEHHKMMDFFCVTHSRCICSFCLQQVHKGCTFSTPDEQRALKQSDLRDKLSLLGGKIKKNQKVISQMNDMETKIKDSASSRKSALESEYQQMRELLDSEFRTALNAVDQEQETAQTSLQRLVKRFSQNVEQLSAAKDGINGLLGQSQTVAFLQASVDLPSVVSFDPYTPRITLDSKAVTGSQAFAAVLKEYLLYIFKQPIEARLQMLKPELNIGMCVTGEQNASHPGLSVFSPARTGPQSLFGAGPPHQGQQRPFGPPHQGQQRHFGPPHQGQERHFGAGPPLQGQERHLGPPLHLRSPSPGAPLRAGQAKKPPKQNKDQTKKKETDKQGKKPPCPQKDGTRNMKAAHSTENLLDLTMTELDVTLKETPRDRPQSKEPSRRGTPEPAGIPPSITSAAKRTELLQYGTVLTFDPKTAHKRIALSEEFTKATVSDEPATYPDGDARFTVCTQVLASKGFARGRHYWEVKMSSNNFIGIGIAYNSIDRKGPSSRMGRNRQSWCVEWFNVKLSAWHASSETVLANSSPKRVGVLLDCEDGAATFYNVADRAYPFHTFVFPFTETVYPAFWIFSSGSSVSLCKMQA